VIQRRGHFHLVSFLEVHFWSRVKAEGENTYMGVFNLGVHECLVVLQGRAGKEPS